MKKHTKQIVSGIILFVLAAIIVPTLFVISLLYCIWKEKPLAKFMIPGQVVVSIEKQGRYYLWNDYQTIFEGRTYSSSEELPGGLEISLSENEDGVPIEFVPDQLISSSSGDSHKKSIGYFEIREPGTYILNVFGEIEPRIFSFGKSLFNAKSVFIALIVFPLEMLIGIGGFILVIVGVINLIKAGKCKRLDAGSTPV